MSKLNIIFNGTEYPIDEAALASAKDSLKTHLSTVMNGSGGGLATITWDGVVGDRVFIEQDDGTIHVKVSDNPVTIDDLVGATVTLTVNDSTYNSTIDRESIYDFGGIAVTASVIAVFAADNAMSLEPGVYFLWNEDGYISSLTFPSTSSAGSTIITFDGTSYQVDPTKLQVATDNFVAHVGTLTGGDTKLTIGGVDYMVDSAKMSKAVADLETVLGGLNAGGGEGGSGSDEVSPFTAGLYETGAISIYSEQGAEAIEGMLITPWDELVANGTVHVENGVVHTNINMSTQTNASSDILAGDLILPSDGSITSLGERAFASCKKLTSITIPDSVTSICNFALFGVRNLTNIIFEGAVEQWNSIEKGTMWIYNTSTSDTTATTDVICSDGTTTVKWA